MKPVLILLFALVAYVSTDVPVQATDSCGKDCRDFLKACQKAHSQGACKTDYDICVKHCKEK
jgi:hypothetical protein